MLEITILPKNNKYHVIGIYDKSKDYRKSEEYVLIIEREKIVQLDYANCFQENNYLVFGNKNFKFKYNTKDKTIEWYI